MKPNTLALIENLFDDKGWDKELFFNSFCKTYESMKTEEEKELLLNLMHRFIYIPMSRYDKEIVGAIDKMHEAKIGRNLLIYSASSPKEYGYVKSNYVIAYMFKGLALRKKLKDYQFKVKVINSIKELLQIRNLQNYTLLLVDDFIGSGATIHKAFWHIQCRMVAYGKNPPKYAVLGIVAMECAKNALEREHIPVFASYLVNRGISDYYTGQDLDVQKRVMKGIESRIDRLHEAFKFGYKQSEALVCMERCPNNTFPVFWLGKDSCYARS